MCSLDGELSAQILEYIAGYDWKPDTHDELTPLDVTLDDPATGRRVRNRTFNIVRLTHQGTTDEMGDCNFDMGNQLTNADGTPAGDFPDEC